MTFYQPCAFGVDSDSIEFIFLSKTESYPEVMHPLGLDNVTTCQVNPEVQFEGYTTSLSQTHIDPTKRKIRDNQQD